MNIVISSVVVTNIESFYQNVARKYRNTYDYGDMHRDIDNAIDANGNNVKLASIDFIKIYTGVLQANGPLGECSTEVAAIEQIVYK